MIDLISEPKNNFDSSLTYLKTAYQLHKSQTGSLYHYTLIILITLTLILCLRQFWVVFNGVLDFRSLILIIVTLFFLTNSK